ncbi:MAG: sigma-54 dependent transcriptional regulator [Pseudomonadales bacterium]
MPDARNVMVIDDEPAIVNALHQLLTMENYHCTKYQSPQSALQNLTPDWSGVILSDINMPGMNGIEFLKRATEIDSEYSIILLTGHGDISMAVDAMRNGAYDFLEKPFSNDSLLESINRAYERRQLVLENRDLRIELEAQSGPGPRILGSDPKILELRKLLTRIKDTPADVLIQGETGTGKELVARFLHDHSVRSSGPFVAINCGAIPESLIESELFGHEAGAFTGAKQKRIGKFEYANGGTLFLDEIESMPELLQVNLLRVLEQRTIEPLGSNKSIPIDTRILAATKTDLKQMSEDGTFREDLYYRLNVISVSIPPLRERVDDIPLLFENFLRLASARYHIDIPEHSKHQAWLKSHNWPGNVRELRNVAERLLIMGDEALLDVSELDNTDDSALSLADQVSRFEKMVLQDALMASQGKLKPVQEKLGLPRKTLYEKLRKHGLDKENFKD